jgi:hypothetical protein
MAPGVRSMLDLGPVFFGVLAELGTVVVIVALDAGIRFGLFPGQMQQLA